MSSFMPFVLVLDPMDRIKIRTEAKAEELEQAWCHLVVSRKGCLQRFQVCNVERRGCLKRSSWRSGTQKHWTSNPGKNWEKKCLEKSLLPINKFFRRCRGLKLWARMQQTSAVVRRYLATFSSRQHQFEPSCWSACLLQYKPPIVVPRMMCNGLRQVQYFVNPGFLSKLQILPNKKKTFHISVRLWTRDFQWLRRWCTSLENHCTGPDSLGLEIAGPVDLQCQTCNLGMQMIISG